MQHRKLYAGLGGILMAGTVAVAGIQASNASESASSPAATPTVALDARLHALNDSGATGHAHVEFKGKKAHVRIDARRLAKGLPHAQHLHFGADARHECPSVFDDSNVDHRLNVAEGVPAYGPILRSLTTKGDTSPESGLAVDRFPITPNGVERYERSINFSPGAVTRAIKHGKGVVVIHGVDHNGNGTYDFEGAGVSELDPNLPAEATDPALCGVLR
ncbi:hypothetical protein [Nocardioides sp. LHG3406-4]|uniref:hypothetical protein n=1 Tax=Nocardioides sp. LHG3406-4 TaxID=2804575 RepID=UPI003CF2983F